MPVPYPYGLQLRVELINRIYNWFIVEYREACYGEFILKMLAEYGNYLKYVFPLHDRFYSLHG